MMKVFSDMNNSMCKCIKVLLCCTMLCCVFVANVKSAEKKQNEENKKSPTLILESANSNENTFENDEFISVLKGNVVFTYDDIRICSDDATWWRNQGRVNFRSNVRVFRGAQTVTCDQMTYAKTNGLLVANGRFVFVDTLERTKITGSDAEYNIQTKYFQLTGKPKMIRYDTATAETLFISAERMWYVDSVRCATVVDSVKIIKGKLFSTCKAAKYYTKKDYAQLRQDPFVIYEISNVKGDSIDLFFGKNQLQSATVMGHAIGKYIDTIANTKDSSYTNVWGDSLLMSVSDSGNLDSLWIYGKAKSKYFDTKDRQSVNEASGKKMLMAFTEKGVADKVKIWGNAKSKYFVTEQKSKGINEASGDSITVTFKKGRASRLTLAGSARGIYFPRDL